MAKKATAHDAQLILKLYDLRREEEMRKARHWLTAEFWPQSADEFIKVVDSFPSQENAWLRQAGGDWVMAAALVVHARRGNEYRGGRVGCAYALYAGSASNEALGGSPSGN